MVFLDKKQIVFIGLFFWNNNSGVYTPDHFTESVAKKHEEYVKLFTQLRSGQYRAVNKEFCPHSLEMLRSDEGPDYRNYLSFPNFSAGGGRCRGMAVVAQRFGHLAVWDTPRHAREPLCGATQEMTKECLDYYQKKIDLVISKKIAEFPGFKNLAEFSLNEEIAELLHQAVASIPKEYTLTGVAIGFSREGIARVADRVKAGQMTHINIKWAWSGGHALVGYDVRYKKEHEQDVVCVIDSNYPVEKAGPMNCENYLYQSGGGVAYHYVGGVLGQKYFSVLKEDDANMIDYMHAKIEYCRQKSKLSRLIIYCDNCDKDKKLSDLGSKEESTESKIYGDKNSI